MNRFELQIKVSVSSEKWTISTILTIIKTRSGKITVFKVYCIMYILKIKFNFWYHIEIICGWAEMIFNFIGW